MMEFIFEQDNSKEENIQTFHNRGQVSILTKYCLTTLIRIL